MSITKKPQNSQFIIFSLCLIVFIASAILGWHKLRFGFNFIDEGYHATESWRLAAGDDFLEDKITGALMHYTLINRIVFEIYPGISLLEWRQLQFILVIFSLLLFSFALFRYNNQYAWLPLTFSLFAFTGFDPIGMISNMYYQTYPHLFIVCYLSFLLLGLQTKNPLTKNILYLMAGVCIWLTSLSLLYLGTFIFAPLFLFILSRKTELINYSFSFQDLLYVTTPFVICWLLFIAIFNKAYLLNLFNSLDVYLSMPDYSKDLMSINWELIKHVTASAIFLSIFFIVLTKLPVQFFLPGFALLSLTMLLIINTSFFGFMTPYYDGWLGKPMWFSSLLMAFSLFFWIYTMRKYFLNRTFSKEEELSIILMVPFTICAFTMSVFSALGSLSVCQTAIPAVAAISLMVASQIKNTKYQHTVATLVLIMFLGPFYYSTIRNDWDFTYFDVKPNQANVRIKTGFGRGIYTNQLYSELYDWLVANASAFAQPGEYAISYIVSPMVHMITRLHPSLDDTFITFFKPMSYYEKCIQEMKQRGREPKIAFIFERMPFLLPGSVERGSMAFPGKQFDFRCPQDPISTYVKMHMKPASTFKISENQIIRCYVNTNLSKKSSKPLS